jgi:hypothetical protein
MKFGLLLLVALASLSTFNLQDCSRKRGDANRGHMERCCCVARMVGDLVICIGQNSEGIGKEISRISSSIESTYPHQYLFIDDSSQIHHPTAKNTDSHFSFLNKAHRWDEAYSTGHLLIDCILSKIENCDSPRALTLLYDANTGLGSGLSKYLTHFTADSLPGLSISNIGILPHFFRGGISAIQTIMAMESALNHQCQCYLRCLKDNEYLLDSNGISSQSVGLSHIYTAIASDLSHLLPDPSMPYSFQAVTPPQTHFRSVNLLDIRSSRWATSLRKYSQKKPKQSAISSNSFEKILRQLCVNLHSLHVSSTLLSQTSPQSSSSSQSSVTVSRAVISCLSAGGSDNRGADFSRLGAMLQGACPGLTWPQSIPSQCCPLLGRMNEKEQVQEDDVALLFTSPYSDDLLRLCYQDARASHAVGAYRNTSPGCEEDEALALEQIQEYLCLEE